MITCRKCNTQLTEGSRFCYNCGTEVAVSRYCNQCGAPISDEFAFCKQCGTPTAEPVQASETAPIQEQVPTVEPIPEIVSSSVQNMDSEPLPTIAPLSDFEPLPTIAPLSGSEPLPTIAPLSDFEPLTTIAPESDSEPLPTISSYSEYESIPSIAPVMDSIPLQTVSPIPYQRPNEAPTPVPYQAQATYPQQPYPMEGMPTKKKSKVLPAMFAGVGALVLIVLLAFLVPKVMSNFMKAPEGITYVKDGELNYTSLAKIKTKEISNGLFRGASERGSYGVSDLVSFSEDGKRMFYPEDISDTATGVTLYYCNPNAKNPEGKKIDTEVTSYVINREGTKVYYLKGSDHDFYVSNLSDEDKIDNDVYEFYLDDTGKKLVYSTYDGTIYTKDGSKDKEKVDKNSTLKYVSEDFKTIYYLKDNSLYVKTGNKDGEKISSEVSDVLKIYDSGEIYYVKSKETQMKLSEFVNDDLAESDAAMEQPIEPNYPNYDYYQPTTSTPTEPSYWDYTDYEGYVDWDSYYDAYDDYSAQKEAYNQEWNDAYNAAVEEYNTEYDAYTQKYNEYYDKQDRDSLRDSLTSETVTLTVNSLYYYADGDSKQISDNYNYYEAYSNEKPVFVYENKKDAEFNKLNISDDIDFYDVQDFASQTTSTATEAYVAVGAQTSKINKENVNNFSVNSAGDTIYFYADYDMDKGSGDLYSAKIDGSTLASPTKVENDVYFFEMVGSDDSMTYFKNVESSKGDLYFNNKKINSDVNVYSVVSLGDKDKFIYFTDYDDIDYTYTLKLYDGKESINIAKDVNTYNIIEDNKIVYLSDYDSSDLEGDVYLYNDSKKKLIDENVNYLVYTYDNYSWGGGYSEE